jgi:protein N-terminal amidase
LGRGEKELLVVDTNKRPQAKLVSEPGSASEAKREAVLDKTGRGVGTKNTTIPPSELSAHSLTVDDIVTPLSPVEPISHHAYFAPKGRGADDEIPHESLESSTAQSRISGLPNAPMLKRPESPKSRNASRTRQSEQQMPAPASHGLANEEKIIERGIEVELSPYFAPIAPDLRKTFATDTISLEDARKLPRPKSAVW